MNRVSICTKCIARNEGVPDSLLNEVRVLFSEKHPELQCRLLTTGCIRLCPPNRYALVVNQRMTMSLDLTTEGIVKEIASLLSQSSKQN